MHKRILIAVLCAFLLPVALQAQSGKISGKVTDRETGEPLIGANIVIEGTKSGATTNINGEFVILNVEIGKVSLVCKYVGYTTLTIRDVLIRSNETSTRDFQLVSEAVKLGDVVIEAIKPMIDRNVTNSKATVTSDDIENLPVRGVEGIVSLQAGIVNLGGTLYVRGSRGDATGYAVDGVSVNNPVFGGRALTVINNAIAEVSFQAGGYSAEFGGANGGLVSTITKSGSRKLQVSFEGYTDSWMYTGWDRSTLPTTARATGSAGEYEYFDANGGSLGTNPWDGTRRSDVLGGYSAGFSNYQLTVGGPIYGPVKFFVAAQNSFTRNGSSFAQAISLTEKYDAILRGTSAHALLDPLEQAKVGIFNPQQGSSAKKADFTWPAGGWYMNGASQSWAMNGNLTFDLNPVNIRLGGTYAYGHSRGGAGMTTLANQVRASETESEDYSANLKLTHLLTQNTFYELYFSYFGNFGVTYDPDLKHDIFAYQDSVANAAFGYTYRANDVDPLTSVVFTTWYPYGYQMAGYSKARYNKIMSKLNFIHQIGRTHEIRVGGEAERWTIRSYSVAASSLWPFLRQNPDATADQIAFNARSNFYGYTQWGQSSDEGFDGPKHPVFAGAYAMDKIELEDLVINVGLRYDFIDTDSKKPKDMNNIKFLPDGNLDPDGLEDAPVSQTVSPRIGFSFPVTDQTRFYAQYGRFVQQSRLRDVYLGNAINASNIRGGYAISTPVGFGLKPENTIQYDFGFQQMLGENIVFNINAFYKDIRDQVQIRQVTASPGASHLAYYAWVNGDFSTTSGVELSIDMRRLERLQASLDYTYSDARGTGSAPSTAFYAIWQSPTETPYYPKIVQPTDFDQTHRGSVNLDYRFGRDDGPAIGGIRFLERTGLNLLFQFNSGTPYTLVDEYSFGNRHQPVEAVNSSRTPWTFCIDGRLDKSVNIWEFNVNFYVWVINLLNTKYVTDVFSTTGSASDNGYLSTDEGKALIKNYASYGDVFEQLYRDYYYQMAIMNAGVYGTPRQLRLGMRIDF